VNNHKQFNNEGSIPITITLKRNNTMNANVTRILTIIIIGCLFFVSHAIAENANETDIANLTSDNITALNSTIEYPSDKEGILEGINYGLSGEGYADVGGIRTGFSGSSLEAEGDNHSPSVAMSFSDKSAVSGFIKSFMKSFHYESSIDI